MKECVNYYTLSHEFRDMLSMYTLDCTKTSFSVIRNAVYDKFAGVCCGWLYVHMLVLPTLA